MINFSLDTKQFQKEVDESLKKQDKKFPKIVFASTLKMHSQAKKNIRNQTMYSKVRSSFLINNIQLQISNNGLTGAVISRASYSEAVEKGTRPHLIKIRRKKILAGPKRGAPAGWPMISGDYAIYGKQVAHPGTKPKPFIYPAWKFANNHFEKAIKAALS